MTEAEILDKYRSNARLVLSEKQIERSIELVQSLDKLENINELYEILAAPPAGLSR